MSFKEVGAVEPYDLCWIIDTTLWGLQMFKFTIYQGELIVGGSRKPTNVEVNEEGVGIGAFKRTVYPWSEISEVIIDGPQSRQSRVTATRLVALGVFALAAKKNTTETLTVISLKSGQVITVMFNRKSELEVKAIFAPFKGLMNARIVNHRVEAEIALQTDNSKTSKSRTEQLRELSELLDRGLIDQNEFMDLKTELLNSGNSKSQEESADKLEFEPFELPIARPRPELVDGDRDEHGVECIVRRPTDKVGIMVINRSPSKIDSLAELLMTLVNPPSDRKIQKKWAQNYRKNFSEAVGRGVGLVFSMQEVEYAINAFEEYGCEVVVGSSRPPFEKLSRGNYRFIEISENEDPFETPEMDSLVGVGIYSWDKTNEDLIIEILWDISLKSPLDRYINMDQIPATISSWYMKYGTTLEIFPELEALGCKMKRLRVVPPDLAKRLLGL